MEPFSFIAGVVVGFVSGVTYGRARAEPWRDIRNSAIETILEVRRVFKDGPKAPEEQPEDIPDTEAAR